MAGLYVHVPFRRVPCLYDDSPVVLARPPYAGYLRAVTAELAHYGARYAEPIRTLYVGGGRPSLLDLDALDRLWTAVRAHFDADALEEATLELNPDDARPAYLRGLRRLGFDRLSLDVMSFYDRDLKTLQAPHTADQAAAALDAARDAGFDNVSIDLFFGAAAQENLHWKANVQRAARRQIPHIALAECTGDQLAEASDEARTAQLRFAMDYLPAQGYEHYEVSHFARPGRRGLHNQRHWDHTNYLGVGPSAHSFWWVGDTAHRWANVRNLARYEALLQQQHTPVARRTPLDADDLAAEYVMLRLRTRDGLDLDTLRIRYGVDLYAQKADVLARLVAEDYLAPMGARRFRPTPRGLLVCNALTQHLLPD